MKTKTNVKAGQRRKRSHDLRRKLAPANTLSNEPRAKTEARLLNQDERKENAMKAKTNVKAGIQIRLTLGPGVWNR